MLRPLTGMLVIAAFLAILAGPNAPAQEMEVDTFTGLKMSDDWELVRNNCIACHSLKLVTQQRGSATQWLSVIRWMQAKQNLWQFDPDTENRIINYLAENYPPQAEQRRAALAPQLMPPNPYAADSK
jgi:cytochrome c1